MSTVSASSSPPSSPHASLVERGDIACDAEAPLLLQCGEVDVESELSAPSVSSVTVANLLSWAAPDLSSTSKARPPDRYWLSALLAASSAVGLLVFVGILLSQLLPPIAPPTACAALDAQSSFSLPLPPTPPIVSSAPLSPSPPAALAWPFRSANSSVTRSSWINLLATVYGEPAAVIEDKEAAFISDYAVASMSDLLDLTSAAPPPHYETCEQAQRMGSSDTSGQQLDRRASALDLHISSAPQNSGRRQQLDRQLSRQGFTSWKYHSKWTKELMLTKRELVSQWMYFPADDNSPGLLDSISYSHLNYLEHMDMLSTIAEANSPSLSLILEDDAVLTPFFRQRMAWLASVVPATATTVFFGGCLNKHVPLRSIEEQDVTATAAEAFTADSCSGLMLPAGTVTSCRCVPHRPAPMLVPQSTSRCASGYMMSAQGAARIVATVKRLVAETEISFSPFDWLLGRVFETIEKENSNTASVYLMEPPASYELGKICNQTVS